MLSGCSPPSSSSSQPVTIIFTMQPQCIFAVFPPHYQSPSHTSLFPIVQMCYIRASVSSITLFD